MTTPKTGSPEWAGSQATPHTTVNEALRRIEAGSGYYRIEDKDLSSPPGSCADGAQYIVAATGSGAWAGHTGDIAIASGTNAANGWYFIDPEEGLLAKAKDEDVWYHCTLGTSPATWAAFTAADLGGLTESVQDIVGAMVIAGSGASVSYDDGAGTLTISATGGGGGGSVGGGATTPPQGRLTLTSLTPVMTADVTATSAVYYTPYIGEFIPIYESGSPLGWTMTEFSQLTLTLDTNSPSNHASGSLYDIFVWNDAGTVRIGTGPAWSSPTSRGTGAGTTELQMKDGIWTNAVTIDLINNTTTYSSIPQNEATYVGTIYCTAAGQTGMAMAPAAAAGGSNNILGVYNAYNRVRTTALMRPSDASWTYATANTWRAANASNSNRISFVDGLRQSHIEGRLVNRFSTGASRAVGVGMNLDSTSATPQTTGLGVASSTSVQLEITANDCWLPQIGFHYIQACEITDGTTTTTFLGFTATFGYYHSMTIGLEM